MLSACSATPWKSCRWRRRCLVRLCTATRRAAGGRVAAATGRRRWVPLPGGPRRLPPRPGRWGRHPWLTHGRPVAAVAAATRVPMAGRAGVHPRGPPRLAAVTRASQTMGAPCRSGRRGVSVSALPLQRPRGSGPPQVACHRRRCHHHHRGLPARLSGLSPWHHHRPCRYHRRSSGLPLGTVVTCAQPAAHVRACLTPALPVVLVLPARVIKHAIRRCGLCLLARLPIPPSPLTFAVSLPAHLDVIFFAQLAAPPPPWPSTLAGYGVCLVS